MAGARYREPPSRSGIDAIAPPGWRGRLAMHYSRDAARTLARDRHEGPLRVLQRLYPEGPGVCHHVLVHPPGGIVGGDVLEIDVAVDTDAHALITTPGATRYYRSAGAPALQRTRLSIAGRLEWLPLEAIAYNGCRAENRIEIALEPGGETIGWDVLALGLPASARPFEHGCFIQHLEWPGVWLERGSIDAADRRLLRSPLGLGGRAVLGALWFCRAAPIDPASRAALLDAARRADPGAEELLAGASSFDERLVVLRLLADRVEPALRHLTAVWSEWRRLVWGLPPCLPRVWRT